LRILVISAAFPPIKSGGSDFAMRLCEFMSLEGMDVRVLTSVKTRVANAGYQVIPAIKRWGWSDLSTCCRTISQLKPDVIDIQFTGWIFHDHPMITFLPSVIRRILPTAHISVHIESLQGILRERSSFWDAAIRYAFSCAIGRSGINYEYGSLIRDCDSLILLNERDKTEICSLFPGSDHKCTIMPPPPIMQRASQIDTAAKHKLLEHWFLQGSDLVIAFYGYIYPGKGLETLFASLKQLQETGVNAGLLIIGDVPEQMCLERCGAPHYLPEMKSLSERLGIARAVRWVGYSDSNSLVPSQLLQASDICVIPFDAGVMLNNSSFSFAAMHGIPIITTRGHHTEAAFEDGFNAKLVNPRDPEELTEAILQVSRDRELKDRLSSGAIALADKVFNWKDTVRKTMQVWGARRTGQIATAKLKQ
jgi:glycosyltransferase involved in cell wall biosynthesis